MPIRILTIIIFLVLSIGLFLGVVIAEAMIPLVQEELMKETQAQLLEAKLMNVRLRSRIWVLGCSPRPVADFKSWDEDRRLVTLACLPAIEIPVK